MPHRLAAPVLAWTALAAALCAQTGAEPTVLGTLTGGQVQVTAPHAEAARLGAEGHLQVANGATIRLQGPAARLDLRRGGSVRMCGPARMSVSAGGRQALLFTLGEGAIELRYASNVTDTWLTPDFRITTVVPPLQLASVSASLAIAPSGTICLMNRGSALSVTSVWTGAQRYVINGQTLELSPSGAIASVAGCPCATPAPAAVPVPANGPAVLFPHLSALSVTANHEPTASAPAVRPLPAPRAAPHHNFLVRFLRWLIGK